MAVTAVDQRTILDTGTVVCKGSEITTINVQGNVFLLSFVSNQNQQGGMAFTAQAGKLLVTVTNADVPIGSPILETSSSFVGSVGHTAQGKEIILILYVHSRGQEKTRHVAYTFSA
jgi:hypothetical protein